MTACAVAYRATCGNANGQLYASKTRCQANDKLLYGTVRFQEPGVLHKS